MRRDLWAYLRALWKHWASLLAGPTVTILLLIWQVFGNANIPQRGLFGAELALTEAERDQLVAAVALYEAVGAGWPAAQGRGSGS